MDNVNNPDLVLDANGICNHCHGFDEALAQLPKGEEVKKRFVETISAIKKSGRKKKYDCIIGISGGVDSTYLAYLAKQNGLRVLFVYCDNGWNTELSVKNIENVCRYTGFDLYTLVIDWEEFKDIQLSFFKAGVIDIELVYDYAFIATIYKAALKSDITFVLTGHNLVTEGNYLPKSWRHNKYDFVNIKAIHKLYGKIPFKTFPIISFIKQRIVDRKLKYLYLLNYTDYNKEKAKQIIKKELNWKDYGGKHFENIFTRFYQGFILKEKFKVDKRQFHLSVLVQSGQITREEALRQYALPAYNPDLLKEDKEYVMKKFGFTEQTFQEYMNAPIKKHTDYANVQKYWDVYFKLIKVLSPFKKLLKS